MLFLAATIDSAMMLDATIFLGAAVILIPLAKRFGIATVLGYLFTGLLLGPSFLKVASNPNDLLHFSEFGVVLLLFIIGLELQPSRLWALRHAIFVLGGLQVTITGVVLMLIAWHFFHIRLSHSFVIGFGLALSSTAFVLQLLSEKKQLSTTHGQQAFTILLFQDIAVIPLLAALPFLSGAQEQKYDWIYFAKVVSIFAGMVFVSRFVVRPFFKFVASSKATELLTAAALFIVLGVSLLMNYIGLSMALGAFLTGVLLADSEYRHELEASIEPFKGLLLGLFFMSVGMLTNVKLIAAKPLLIIGGAALLMFIKFVLITLIARATGNKTESSIRLGVTLAQGGEFAFVVFQTASSAKVLAPAMASQLTGAVALSMLLSPLLLVLLDRLVLRHFTHTPAATGAAPAAELSEPQQAPILIAGFGRYGQIVARVLLAQGVPTTVLDHSVEMLEVARTFGYRVHYGDATRLHLLRTAGAAQARVLVVAVDTPEQSLKIVQLARKHFPHLEIVARARDITHWNQLRELGVTHIERELFESSLASARSTLHLLGLPDHEVQSLIERFRTHNLALIEQLHPYRHDREKFINFTRQGREQLVAQLAKERQERQRDPTPTPPPATPSP